MRNSLLLILLSLASAGNATAAEKVLPPGLAEKVEDRLSEIRSFNANFKQVFHNAAMGTVEESRGTVSMQKPLKMRWEYNVPAKQSVVSDGKSIYFYYPSEKRAIKQPIGNVINAKSPALFLSSGGKLREIFIVKPARKGDEIGKMDGKILLSLEPKERSVSVTRIVIAVSADDHTVRSLSIYDWTGNRSDMEFTEMEINVKNGPFVFKAPKGVELLDAPEF